MRRFLHHASSGLALLLASLLPLASAQNAAPLPSTNPDTLIARLGAPRYADREAAARSLEHLGRAALPPLRTAREDRDPEIRSRAALLLDRIERDLLLRATPVALPSDLKNVRQAVELLAAHLGSPLAIDEAGLGDRLLVSRSNSNSLTTPTFWQFFEEQHLDLSYPPERRQDRFDLGRPVTPRVMTRTPSLLRRDQISGPFRISVQPLGSSLATRNGRPSVTHLKLAINVMAEPRLAIRPEGPLRLLEILDDQNRKWASAEELEPVLRSTQASEFARAVQAYDLLLIPPQGPPARSLRLRGSIPLQVDARKLDPIVINLPADEGKPLWCGDVTLIARGATENAASPASFLDLTIRPQDWTIPFVRGARPRMFELFNNQIVQTFENLELADDQNRPIAIADTRNMRPSNEGFRIIFSLDLPEPTARLAQIRYYGRLQTTHELPFQFDDIPLPQP
jgi:hypothetical protein